MVALSVDLVAFLLHSIVKLSASVAALLVWWLKFGTFEGPWRLRARESKSESRIFETDAAQKLYYSRLSLFFFFPT